MQTESEATDNLAPNVAAPLPQKLSAMNGEQYNATDDKFYI